VSKPTAGDLLEAAIFDHEGLFLEYESFDDSWRHGVTVTQVFRDSEEGKYWQVVYNKSTDGETNGLRDGDYFINEVEPYDEVVTRYRRKRYGGAVGQ